MFAYGLAAQASPPGPELTAATGLGCRRHLFIERQRRAAAGEDAVMGIEIADELEMHRETALGEHAPGIAAYGKYPARFDSVVAIEHEGLRHIGERALIDHGLTVILTGRLQRIDIE